MYLLDTAILETGIYEVVGVYEKFTIVYIIVRHCLRDFYVTDG